MPTYRLTVTYDGTHFHGWQRQPSDRSVQGELMQALETVLGEPVPLAGAGRTDAGVHADAQEASFLLDREIDPRRVTGGVNALIGEDVVVRRIARVADAFHARFSARSRTYRYRLLDAPSAIHRASAWHPGYRLEMASMLHATQAILGEHDFGAFAASADTAPHKRCNVSELRWERWEEGLAFWITADRFLHHMVRNVVGTLVEIGRGRWPAARMREILDSCDRRQAGPTAPARGLTLVRVAYDEADLRPPTGD